MSNLDLRSLLDGNRVFEEFKGSLTERFALQQLTASHIEPFYWSTENATAELNFIFQAGENIVPLEVKAAEYLQAKSLKSYCNKYCPKYAIRSSMSDFREEESMSSLPLYAVNILKKYVSTK